MSRVCIKDRVCKECGKEFAGDRFTCPQCRYKTVKASGKFGRKYHHDYYHKFLKVASEPRETKGDVKQEMRRAALARQAERIHGEMEAITSAGLDPATALYHDYCVVLQSRTSSTYHNTPAGGGNETPCTNGKILVQNRNEAGWTKRTG